MTFMVSLVAQLVKNPPAMWETWVQSRGWEDPLEKEMATHSLYSYVYDNTPCWQPNSSILAGRIPWAEEPGRLHGSQRVRHNCETNFQFHDMHNTGVYYSF